MRVIIAYDISDDQQRARVAAVLSAWGDRLQKSVFACTMDAEELRETMSRIADLIDPRTDSVHLFHQCATCHEQAAYIGQAVGFDPPRYWVV